MGLLFSPNGRINQSTYWRGVVILAAISALLWILSAYVAPFIFMLGVVFWWPWIAVHVKRLHDADQSGLIVLALIVAALVLYFVLNSVFSMFLGGGQAAQLELQEQMMEALEDEDFAAYFASISTALRASLPATLLTLAAMTGIIGFGMSFFKSTPGDNKFGPPEGSVSGDTFT
jgi:uncharacterized membrane protein YhaH (DUF805 family)